MGKNFAQLNGANTVFNIIYAETLEDAQLVTNNSCVEYEGCVHIGQVYDAQSKTFSWPTEVTQGE